MALASKHIGGEPDAAERMDTDPDVGLSRLFIIDKE